MLSLYAIECSIEHTVMTITMFGNSSHDRCISLKLWLLGNHYIYSQQLLHLWSFIKLCSGTGRCLRFSLFMPSTLHRIISPICPTDVHALLWRHNGCDGFSNHKPRDCLLNRLFRRRSKITWKLRVTGLFAPNSPVTGEFPAKMASNMENVSIWWCHHGAHIRKTSSRL